MIDLIYKSLGRYAEDDRTGHLRGFIEAIAGDLEWFAAVLEEGDNGEPPWHTAFDPDRAPEQILPWLAQFVGVEVTPAMTALETRGAIKTPNGFSVGTIDAIRAGIQRTLTGTKRVVIRQRTPDATSIYIRTLLSETPDPAATEKLIRKKLIPWHLVLEYEAVSGVSYIDLAAMFEDYDALAAADLTYDEVSELTP